MRYFHYYILDGHTPKPVSFEEYSAWMKENFDKPRHVAKTDIYPRGPKDGYIHVSTVFLNIDHSYTRRGPPVLFETMIFPEGGEWNLPLPDDDGNWNGEPRLSDYQERYTSWESAEEGHKKAVALVHEALSRMEQR